MILNYDAVFKSFGMPSVLRPPLPRNTWDEMDELALEPGEDIRELFEDVLQDLPVLQARALRLHFGFCPCWGECSCDLRKERENRTTLAKEPSEIAQRRLMCETNHFPHNIGKMFLTETDVMLVLTDAKASFSRHPKGARLLAALAR